MGNQRIQRSRRRAGERRREGHGCNDSGAWTPKQLPCEHRAAAPLQRRLEPERRELHIAGIDGSKDVSAQAGELHIEVGDTAQYRNVNASVRIGEVNAEAFHVEKGGFFRSFQWTGKGPYDLRASLTVGELTLGR